MKLPNNPETKVHQPGHANCACPCRASGNAARTRARQGNRKRRSPDLKRYAAFIGALLPNLRKAEVAEVTLEQPVAG